MRPGSTAAIEFGRVLKCLRQNREPDGSLMQKTLAEELGWSQTKISQAEKGQRPPLLADVEHWARGYAVDVERFRELLNLYDGFIPGPDGEWVWFQDSLDDQTETQFHEADDAEGFHDEVGEVLYRHQRATIQALFPGCQVEGEWGGVQRGGYVDLDLPKDRNHPEGDVVVFRFPVPEPRLSPEQIAKRLSRGHETAADALKAMIDGLTVREAELVLAYTQGVVASR